MPYAHQTLTISISTSGSAYVTATPWVPLNQIETPFNVGFGVVKTGNGYVKYSVQHTFDDVMDSTVTPVAFDHSSVSGKTASIDGNYAYPVAAIRVVTVSASSSAKLDFHVRQAGV
jgi:hypothetical protein